jgi:hypothetical protein
MTWTPPPDWAREAENQMAEHYEYQEKPCSFCQGEGVRRVPTSKGNIDIPCKMCDWGFESSGGW